MSLPFGFGSASRRIAVSSRASGVLGDLLDAEPLLSAADDFVQTYADRLFLIRGATGGHGLENLEQRASGAKVSLGLGRISATGTWRSSASASTGAGRIAAKPRPIPRLGIDLYL
jgi:hypothetical protein